VTYKGQDRDPDTFEAQYLKIPWRWSVSTNYGAPIGSGVWGIEWSRDR